MKSATAGKAFGFWNNEDNTFQFKFPPGTCKAEISFMGVTGIHEFYFSKNISEASHMSWEDYDYEYKSEAYMLDREFTKCGRHPPIVERPIPRVENMAEFYNPTRPSHFTNLPPPHNITVEYAEKQMSHRERHLLHMLSTFTNRPACVDEIAVATSLDADGGQTTQNNANSGEEQLIAFGEATVEDVGVGTERNSRTVTFELS